MRSSPHVALDCTIVAGTLGDGHHLIRLDEGHESRDAHIGDDAGRRPNRHTGEDLPVDLEDLGAERGQRCGSGIRIGAGLELHDVRLGLGRGNETVGGQQANHRHGECDEKRTQLCSSRSQRSQLRPR